MKSVDLEELNRVNFRAFMNALSMPGNIKKIKPLYDSNLLAAANVFLYSETSFFYDGEADMSVIEAITNTNRQSIQKADYLFSDEIDEDLVREAKNGDFINPDFSATIIFTCKEFDKTKAVLSGAGIDGTKEVILPCSRSFIDALMLKNSSYPLGIEIFFINRKSEVLALSRTTKVEVL